MAAKKSAEVLIGGKVYTLSGYEEEDYLQQVASYINSKINEINEREEFRKLPQDMKSIMLELNLADEFFKARDKVERFETEMEEKEEELYELKHDLISYEVRIEDLQDKIKNLESDNRELQNAKSRLESSLEDVLLGSVSSGDDD